MAVATVLVAVTVACAEADAPDATSGATSVDATDTTGTDEDGTVREPDPGITVPSTASVPNTSAPDGSSEPADTVDPADSSEPATTDSVAVSQRQLPGECGGGTGAPATGEPIRLGGLATNIPGADFTDVPRVIGIYFDCVNANGGIAGRPIEYSFVEVVPDPGVVSAAAVDLVENSGVLAVVGNMAVLDCAVNERYYTEHGMRPVIAGIDGPCFISTLFSPVNMGPYYSSIGAAQAAVRAGVTGPLVVVTADQPGADFINTGVTSFAEAHGLEGVALTEPVPIADPAGVAQRLAGVAGEDGAIVFNLTGPSGIPLLQAIEQQGLIDATTWASSTGMADNGVAAALGQAWDGKLLVNGEFAPIDSGSIDNEHLLDLIATSGQEIVPGAFPQMGYLIGRITTDALMSIDTELTIESVNSALANVTAFESDMLCKPWYFTNGSSANVANNTDYTFVPDGDRMAVAEECFEIAALPGDPLEEIRSNEK